MRCAALLLVVLALPAVARADGLACRVEAPYRICEGKLASFDGTPLDATVTTPLAARHPPLVVFLHGLLADKGEYLSADREGLSSYKTAHWNNRWFASRGWAVLNYSARGHGDSGGQIELSSKQFEVRDARWLTGLVADQVGASRVAVLGSSYGGGQAWLLLTTPPYGAWRSPHGRGVRLAAGPAARKWAHPR